MRKKKTTKTKAVPKKQTGGATKPRTTIGGPFMASRGQVRRKNEQAAAESRRTGKAVDIITKDGKTERRKF